MKSLGSRRGQVARELKAGEAYCEDIRQRLYVMSRAQFISKRVRDNRLIRTKRLRKMLKYQKEERMLFFSSNEKNFVYIQKVKCKKNRWLCKIPEDITTVMHRKFLSSLMIPGCNEQ